MATPNLVETTKRPGSFCTWTLAVCAPPAWETVPRFKLRCPEAPPVKAAPSGTLKKLTEIAPTVSDFMEIAAEVRLLVPLRCVHPSVKREEPTSNNGRTKRKPISHLRACSQSMLVPCVRMLTNSIKTLIGRGGVINGVAD